MLKEDYKAYNLNFLRTISYILTLNPFCVVVLFRLSSWLYKKNMKILSNIIHAFSIILFSADIAPSAKIGAGFRIAHSVGIVIGSEAVIGRNCQVFQNVTIGSTDKQINGRSTPIIGDNVSVFAGVSVIGAIIVGNNVSIGANSVVVKSIPPNVVVAGNPARIINDVVTTTSLRYVK